MVTVQSGGRHGVAPDDDHHDNFDYYDEYDDDACKMESITSVNPLWAA